MSYWSLMWTFHFFKAGTNFDMNSGRRNYPLWVKSCHDYSPKLVWPGLVRSALWKTVLSAYVSALASDSIQNLGLKFSQWGHLLLKVIPDVFNFCVEQINRLSSARQLGLCSRPYRNVNFRFTWPKYRMARLKSFCESTLLSSRCIRITFFFF